ncbi:MAG: hypothetical protein FWG31_01605 [Oscillospiraceae bacterium]|nr:hypothetical protein [Oscillospiraceae bacterium]
MIDINNYEILIKAQCTLRETSISSHNGQFMTNSTLKVIGFDEVKNQHTKNWGLEGRKDIDKPASNDALYMNYKGDMYFIEFRSGKVEKTLPDLRRKIFESILILTDIIEKGITSIRLHLNYILVFDDSRSEILNKIEEKGKIDKLTYFEGLYFKKVHTISKSIFESNFVSVWESQST